MCCCLAESTIKTVKTSYFGLVSPCSYKRPERNCHTWDNGIPRKTSHLENELLVCLTVGHTVVFLLRWLGLHIFEVYHTCTGEVRHGQLSMLPFSLLPFPHLNGHLTISTHSEANVFTTHRHGSAQSIITTLRLQSSHFSSNAQMYQLLLLYNEKRWETGAMPCLELREGKKVLAHQKTALTRILYKNSTVKVPYSCWCLAGLMENITELTITSIYWIQASVLLTRTSSQPLETGSMCLRLPKQPALAPWTLAKFCSTKCLTGQTNPEQEAPLEYQVYTGALTPSLLCF